MPGYDSCQDRTLCRGQTKTLTARSIQRGELVAERDELQVQRCAGANEKGGRVKRLITAQ